MKRLYNSFLKQNLGTDPIEYQTMLRYIRLLAVETEGILVESDPSDHSIQEQVDNTRFPKNYYRLEDDFPASWVTEEAEEDAFVEDLKEPIPDVLLDPWDSNNHSRD